MKKMLDLLSAEVAKAFAEAGYDEKYARVSLSNRPGSVASISVMVPCGSQRVPQGTDYDRQCSCGSYAGI